MILVAGIGIAGVLTTIFFSFMPPENIQVGSLFRYEATLISGFILMSIPPFIFTRILARGEKKALQTEPA